MDEQPDVSVVIPTFRRETRLAFALDGLAAQTLSKDRFEVIIVRAPEDEETPVTVPPAGLSVEFLESRAPGTAVQRNVGWRRARAPLVVFSDDDCRAAPDWLECLLSASGEDKVILHGRVEPDPEQTRHLWDLARTIRVGPESPWFETCNIAYPRALLTDLEGFDEAFGFMGEDTDLGYRAVAAGARKRFVGDALVWHAVYTRNIRAAIRDAIKRASVPRLVRRYPAIRKSLILGTFTDVNHVYLVIAAVGVAASRRAPILGTILASPYVYRRLRTDRVLTPWGIARSFMTLFSKTTVDVVQVTAYAVSSVKHRSLVL